MRLRPNQFWNPSFPVLRWPGNDAEKRRSRQIGARKIEDPHDPRGYREFRSNVEMRKLMNVKSLFRMASARRQIASVASCVGSPRHSDQKAWFGTIS